MSPRRSREGVVLVVHDRGGLLRLALGLFVGFVLGLALLHASSLHVAAVVQTSALARALESSHAVLQEASRHHARQESDGELARRHRVAACVGGLLELRIPQHGRSVAEHVIRPLGAETFVAGTVRGAVTPAREAAALESISALRPFARSAVISMPSLEDFRATFEAAEHWAELQARSSGRGSGCLLPATSPGQRDTVLPKETCLSLITSPVLGNPRGNTLQELHYQRRCLALVTAHEREERCGERYERVLFTRLEFEWLAPHPPLHLLDSALVWLPTGEDNGGLNDRHWLASRAHAEVVFRRWDMLLDAATYRSLIRDPIAEEAAEASAVGDTKKAAAAIAAAAAAPQFVSSEVFMHLVLREANVRIGRFPNVAFLTCCSMNYEGTNVSARQCFAKACRRSQCPARAIGSCRRTQHSHPALPPPGVKPELNPKLHMLAYKYPQEGRSAILHATALSFRGAAYERADDDAPPRLHIRLPARIGHRLAAIATASGGNASAAVARARGEPAVLYSCLGCDEYRGFGLPRLGCLSADHTYGDPILDAASTGRRPCAYYTSAAAMAAVCSVQPDKERTTTFWLWCHGVEPIVTAASRSRE